jgi:hypothetical protein
MGTRLLKVTACLALLPALPGHLMGQTEIGENLVANGGFAQAVNGRPAQWETAGDTSHVEQSLSVITEKGNPCACLTCTKFEGTGGSIHAMIAQVGAVRLEKGKTYEFSCRVRCEGITGRSVNVAISDMTTWENCGLYQSLALERRWQPFRFLFRATRTVDKNSRLQFWHTSTGTLYLDDVKIVEVAAQQVEFTDVIPPSGGRNLVPNGSFDVGTSGWSSMGASTGWGNMAHLHGEVMSSGDPAHRHFLRIPLGGGRTPVLYFDYLKPVAQKQTALLAAGIGWLPVEKNEPYTLSCDMRASHEGVPAVLGVVAADPSESRWANQTLQQKVTLTKSWNRFVFTFRPGKRYVFVTIGPDLKDDRRVDVDLDNVQLERGGHAAAFTPRTPVEVGIEPSQPGGIFTVGEPAALILRAVNRTPAPAKANILFTVTDYFDRPEKLPPVALEIPALAVVEKRIPLPGDWRGYYRVKAEYRPSAPDNGGVGFPQDWGIGGDFRLAFVPRRRADDSVLGINHAFSDGYMIQLARKAGVDWYRDWSLKWQDIEPSPGEFRWEIADTQIDRVLREGVRLMALLPPFPSADWNSEASPDLPKEGYPGIRLRQAWAPKDPAQLGAFVSRAVERYRDRLKVWEFLNEPVYTNYSLPGEGVREYPGKRYTPADYVRLLKVASEAMRRSDPGCRVMGGVAAGPGHFTRELMDAGILDAINIFNLHIYPGAAAPESFLPEMKSFLKAMDAHGGRKPVWITEFSYYAADDLERRPFIPGEGNWAEERLLRNERECAEYTVRFLALMLANGVEKVFIHSGANGAVNAPDLECCLFAYGGAPRKVLPALAVFTELAGPHPKCILEKTLGEEGHLAAFETGSRSLLVLWSEPEPGGHIAVTGKGIRRLDIMGRDVPADAFRISPSPIYVVGPPGRALEVAGSLRLSLR